MQRQISSILVMLILQVTMSKALHAGSYIIGFQQINPDTEFHNFTCEIAKKCQVSWEAVLPTRECTTIFVSITPVAGNLYFEFWTKLSFLLAGVEDSDARPVVYGAFDSSGHITKHFKIYNPPSRYGNRNSPAQQAVLQYFEQPSIELHVLARYSS